MKQDDKEQLDHAEDMHVIYLLGAYALGMAVVAIDIFFWRPL